jgi:hypothetical protein
MNSAAKNTMGDYTEDFGINNIPFGIASSPSHTSPQCVSRVGNSVVFLATLAKEGVFDDISSSLLEFFYLVCRETLISGLRCADGGNI